MTLADVLDEPGGDLMPPTLRDRTEAWAYGSERECPRCGPHGTTVSSAEPYPDCSTCHGTGKVREPGLVERIRDHMEHWPTRTSSEETQAWLDAIRAELGVPDDR